MRRIKIPGEIRDHIKAHAESRYPQECCGILYGRLDGRTKIVEEIQTVKNATSESPENRYLIPPEAILEAEKHARKHQLELLGYYHSHPNFAAEPSDFDREHAWPWYSYIIVSVLEGRADELKSWELREDRSGFTPEEVLFF